MPQYKIFCARCQEETAHDANLVNGEIICTCNNPVTVQVTNPDTNEVTEEIAPCGRLVKVNAALAPDEIRKYFLEHKESNQGQVVIDEVKLAEDQKVEEGNMASGLSEFEIK